MTCGCEQDSPTSSTENLKSVGNTTVTPVASPVDDSKDLQNNSSHRQPLIAPSSGERDAKRSSSSPRKDQTVDNPPVGPPADDDDDDNIPTSNVTALSLIHI